MSEISIAVKTRIIRDRVVVTIGDGAVPMIYGSIVRCPCCGAAVAVRKAEPCPR